MGERLRGRLVRVCERDLAIFSSNRQTDSQGETGSAKMEMSGGVFWNKGKTREERPWSRGCEPLISGIWIGDSRTRYKIFVSYLVQQRVTLYTPCLTMR